MAHRVGISQHLWLRQNAWHKQHRGEKAYFSSWFPRFQSVAGWLSIVAEKSCSSHDRREAERARKRQEQDTSFEDTPSDPLPPVGSTSDNQLIPLWTQWQIYPLMMHPDPGISWKLQFWTQDMSEAQVGKSGVLRNARLACFSGLVVFCFHPHPAHSALLVGLQSSVFLPQDFCSNPNPSSYKIATVASLAERTDEWMNERTKSSGNKMVVTVETTSWEKLNSAFQLCPESHLVKNVFTPSFFTY